MKRVVITGLGTVNALGPDVKTSWPRMLRGENGIGPIRSFDTSAMPVHFAGSVAWETTEKFGAPDHRKLDPFTMYALKATEEALDDRLDAIQLALDGDGTKARRNVFAPPSLVERLDRITDDQWAHTQPPTATHRQALAWASEAFTEELSRLHRLASDLEDLESRAEAAGAPWTPGRRPAWNR